MKELDKLELQQGQNMSMTLDGWSDAAMQSLYGFLYCSQMVAPFCRRSKISQLTRTQGSSLQVSIPAGKLLMCSQLNLVFAETDTDVGMLLGETIKALKDIGPDKFIAIVTHNAANMVKMRSLVLQDPACAHLIPLR